jgi:hypothetical protein
LLTPRLAIRAEGGAFIRIQYPTILAIRCVLLTALCVTPQHARNHRVILLLVADDLIDPSVAKVGRTGLTVENIVRYIFLKQQLRVSYEQLAFHLSDSMIDRTVARLSTTTMPSRSGLQSTIRGIRPEKLEKTYFI